MAKFLTKRFSTSPGEEARIDQWLNSLNTKEFGVIVVGYTSHEGQIIITVKQWKRFDVPTTQIGVARVRDLDVSQPTEWEEPAINVGDNEEK